MAYSAKDAIETFLNYIGEDSKIDYIEETRGRGLKLTLPSKEKCVVYIYPISHKADDTKNFFDTRDSGAVERQRAWQYSLNNRLKYFCIAVNDQVKRYKNYIFSLECEEDIIAKVSGTIDGSRNGTGTQVVIPNDWAPTKPFERKATRKGFYISAIHKDNIYNYFQLFDNRPYMNFGGMDIVEFNKDESNSDEIEDRVPYKGGGQRIFFGAPGTGKSYSLNQEADDLVNHHTEQIERVTFHPDYTYANFVGTYKPIMKVEGTQEKIAYEYVPGPFMRTLVNALNNPSVPYVLIVEEINRANVSAVFGDVFQLLDRDDYGNSQYNIAASEDIRNYLNKELGQEYNEIGIPSNMFIWVTMNSADQGVYPMDTAFKRRWDFTYFGINDGEENLSENAVDKKFTLGSNNYACTVSWNDLRKAINNELLGSQYNINEDKLMGPFFMSNSALVTEDKFKDVFKNKVLMYLFEDVVKQKRRVFFEKCSSDGKGISYSDICHEFNQKGIEIFPDSIVEKLKSVSTDSSNNMGTEE